MIHTHIWTNLAKAVFVWNYKLLLAVTFNWSALQNIIIWHRTIIKFEQFSTLYSTLLFGTS